STPRRDHPAGRDRPRPLAALVPNAGDILLRCVWRHGEENDGAARRDVLLSVTWGGGDSRCSDRAGSRKMVPDKSNGANYHWPRHFLAERNCLSERSVADAGTSGANAV